MSEIELNTTICHYEDHQTRYYIADSRTKRIDTLVKRMEKLRKIHSEIVMSEEWKRLGIPNRWHRVYRLQKEIEKELGAIAYCYMVRES